MTKGTKPSPADQVEQALEKLDLSKIPVDQQKQARELAQTLASTLVGLTQTLVAGNLDIGIHKLSINRSVFMWHQLSLVSTPLLAGFWFTSCFGWLWRLLKTLFDDEGVDITAGKFETPNGTLGGIGLEININEPEDEPDSDPEPESEGPFDPPESPLVPFDPPEEEPWVQIKIIPLIELPTFPPLPDFPGGFDTWTGPDLDFEGPGISIGIEFKW